MLSSIVRKQLKWSCKHMFIPEQHGFVISRCTITNLVTFKSTISNGLEMSFQTDVIYTVLKRHFSKWFIMDYWQIYVDWDLDFICHHRLVVKVLDFLSSKQRPVYHNGPTMSLFCIHFLLMTLRRLY